MFRWQNVEDKEIFDMTIKMYRDPFVEETKSVAPIPNLELDHYAYKYLNSELFMYQILDINFLSFIEERGDVSRMKKVYIPISQNTERTIF